MTFLKPLQQVKARLQDLGCDKLPKNMNQLEEIIMGSDISQHDINELINYIVYLTLLTKEKEDEDSLNEKQIYYLRCYENANI